MMYETILNAISTYIRSNTFTGFSRMIKVGIMRTGPSTLIVDTTVNGNPSLISEKIIPTTYNNKNGTRQITYFAIMTGKDTSCADIFDAANVITGMSANKIIYLSSGIRKSSVNDAEPK